jgi:hypothetical protein
MKLISGETAIGGRRYKESLPVVTDRQCRAYFHGTLRRRSFFVVFGLLKKIHGRFIVVVFQKVRRFVETHPTGRARCIDIPRSRNVLGLFACFVRHVFFLLALLARGNVFLWAGLVPSKIMRLDTFCCAQCRLRASLPVAALLSTSGNRLETIAFVQLSVVRPHVERSRAASPS